MGAYEADINKADGEFDHDDQAVGVAFDIKNIALITNAICAVAGVFYVCETRPVALFDGGNPVLKGHLCFGALFGVFFQALLCKYPHKCQ
jgi:hypothetical protein